MQIKIKVTNSKREEKQTYPDDITKLNKHTQMVLPNLTTLTLQNILYLVQPDLSSTHICILFYYQMI